MTQNGTFGVHLRMEALNCHNGVFGYAVAVFLGRIARLLRRVCFKGKVVQENA
jgi:hypothetical protein